MIRVLLTGASSFTGAWFARALAEAGAEVVAAARGHLADYDPVRRRRIAWLGERVRLVDGCPFGSSRFLDLVRQVRPVDLYAHHGAAVGDHRRPDFAVLAAVAADTLEIEPVLDALAAAGCSTLLHTGTLFEADEGRGGASSLRAFSPYGLARTLVWQVVRHAAERRRLTLGKFVVASPFGPLEKPCLARHLAVRWLQGEVPVLRQPQLVRDHVQIQPLASAYARFALALPQREGGGIHRLVPSQFPERLDRFADRLARALAPRLGRPCRFACASPPEPSDEPVERCGLDILADLVPGHDPDASWDGYARDLNGTGSDSSINS